MTRVMVFHQIGDLDGYRWTVEDSDSSVISFNDERADFFENNFGSQEARVNITGLAPGSATIEMQQPWDREQVDYRFNEGRGPCTVIVEKPLVK
jgi:hypothetical protein